MHFFIYKWKTHHHHLESMQTMDDALCRFHMYRMCFHSTHECLHISFYRLGLNMASSLNVNILYLRNKWKWHFLSKKHHIMLFMCWWYAVENHAFREYYKRHHPKLCICSIYANNKIDDGRYKYISTKFKKNKHRFFL